jgi:prophage regulatory protein
MDNRIKIIRPAMLAEMLGVSTVTIWRMEKRGELPPKKKLTPRTTGWLESDIIEWLNNAPTVSREKHLEDREK